MHSSQHPRRNFLPITTTSWAVHARLMDSKSQNQVSPFTTTSNTEAVRKLPSCDRKSVPRCEPASQPAPVQNRVSACVPFSTTSDASESMLPLSEAVSISLSRTHPSPSHRLLVSSAYTPLAAEVHLQHPLPHPDATNTSELLQSHQHLLTRNDFRRPISAPKRDSSINFNAVVVEEHLHHDLPKNSLKGIRDSQYQSRHGSEESLNVAKHCQYQPVMHSVIERKMMQSRNDSCDFEINEVPNVNSTIDSKAWLEHSRQGDMTGPELLAWRNHS